MVINHLERHFVTSDASTLMNELDVEHPAAKLIVLAARAQEQEIGDGTNFVRTTTRQTCLGEFAEADVLSSLCRWFPLLGSCWHVQRGCYPMAFIPLRWHKASAKQA